MCSSCITHSKFFKVSFAFPCEDSGAELIKSYRIWCIFIIFNFQEWTQWEGQNYKCLQYTVPSKLLREWRKKNTFIILLFNNFMFIIFILSLDTALNKDINKSCYLSIKSRWYISLSVCPYVTIYCPCCITLIKSFVLTIWYLLHLY